VSAVRECDDTGSGRSLLKSDRGVGDGYCSEAAGLKLDKILITRRIPKNPEGMAMTREVAERAQTESNCVEEDSGIGESVIGTAGRVRR
jgi:hypothetical protein